MKKKCPYCSEDILQDAKKCKHCGEWLNASHPVKKKHLHESLNRWLFIWILTLFSFHLIVWKVNGDFSTASLIWVALLFFDMFVGGIAFLMMLVSLNDYLKDRKRRLKGIGYIFSTIIIFSVFFILIYKLPDISQAFGRPFGYTPTPTPSPSIKPTITPIPLPETPIPTVQPIKSNTKTQTNSGSDDAVHCEISPECGGGTKPLKRSECEKSFCCQVGDKWSLYFDQNKCKQDQANNSGVYLPSTNERKVSYSTSQASVNGTFYCYENKVNEISRYEQLIELRQTNADFCNQNASYEGKNCSKDCPFPDNGCIQSCYDNAYGKCTSQNEELGNMRRELTSLLSKYCP